MPKPRLSADVQASPLDRKLRAAIAAVFRQTHGREMTIEERRIFGLPVVLDPDSRPHQSRALKAARKKTGS